MDVIKEKCTISSAYVYVYTLSSGIKCYIIPKSGFKTYMAMAVVKFGSGDTMFKQNGDFTQIPSGTAHFIEHKLFDKKDKSIFTELSKSGAYVNAFTDFVKTAYYFSCSDGFYNNLRLLMDMIKEPYFDESGVENEKSIIKSEINMYKDIPERAVFSNLTKLMYPDTALGCEIAGSDKSVEKITPEILYACYNAFYTPENISIICSGDIEPEKAALIVQETDFTSKGAERIKEEIVPNKINDYVSKRFDVSEPLFNIGFNHQGFEVCPENTYALKMVFDILSGEGSKLYERLLNKQILTEPLGFSLVCTPSSVCSVISGRSQKPAYAANSFIKTSSLLIKTGVGDTAVKRIKKMYAGRVIRGYNSINAILNAQADLAISGFSLIDAEKAIVDITSDKINSMALEAFKRSNAYLSVIK